MFEDENLFNVKDLQNLTDSDWRELPLNMKQRNWFKEKVKTVKHQYDAQAPINITDKNFVFSLNKPKDPKTSIMVEWHASSGAEYKRIIAEMNEKIID